MTTYPHLFSPIDLGRVRVKNRLAIPPLTSGFPRADGSVSERQREYYAVRARGGFGLIIVEAALIHPRGKGWPHHFAVYDDRYMPGLRQLAEACHHDGCKAFVQLIHCGYQTEAKRAGGQPVAPSAVPSPRYKEVPHALTIPEIEELVECFAQGARRCQEAGFDGVEMHGAHGYLINEFLSPLINHRTDRYGGSLGNRVRFLVEIVRRTRELCGPDFPIGVRLSVDEYAEGGNKPEQSKEIAQMLEKEGVVYIHCSAGAGWATEHWPSVAGVGQATLAHLAAGIKQVVTVPVIAVGRIVEPDVAERVLAQGQADMVALGRASFADPAFPQRVREGNLTDLIPCIGCNACQLRRARLGIACLVNPLSGREYEDLTAPTSHPRTVLVIGSGMAGMIAAWLAAKRGHRVRLWDEAGEPGGQLAWRARVPGLAENAKAIDYYARHLAELGVTVELGRSVTPQSIENAGAEVVIIARSGEPLVPSILGIREAVPAGEVLMGHAQVGSKVAVLGGGLFGGETALFLAHQEKEVTVVTEGEKLATDSHPTVRSYLRRWLKEAGVHAVTGADVQAISNGSLVVIRDGQEERLEPFDSFVLALGHSEGPPWIEALRGKVLQLHLVGDAYEAFAASELVGRAATVVAQI